MDNPKKALVTGGSGFIGGHLVKALRRDGWTVSCLLRASSSRERLPSEGIETVTGELRERDSLRPCLRGVKTVFHLAGSVRGRCREDFFSCNCRGTRNLLEAAREAGGVERFIFVSSLSAAGPSPDGHPLREEEEPRPVSLYGESKLAAERETEKFAEAFPVTILRPAAVYGPGDRESLQVVRLAARGLRFHPAGRGAKFSSLHVEDLVEAILLAAGRTGRGAETFFLSDGNAYDWETTFAALEAELGRGRWRLTIPWGPGKIAVRMAAGVAPRSRAAFYLDKIREMSHKYWVCDIGRARKELGFSPRYDQAGGLRETIRWYRSAGWLK